jgi:uncharacterized LabA/DUF88 family protein
MKNAKTLNTKEAINNHNPPGISDAGTLLKRKAIVFIDGNNLYHNLKKISNLSKKINFNNLGNYICSKFDLELTEIRYYNSIPSKADKAFLEHNEFLINLKKEGIIVKTRELQGKGKIKREKGIDILLALEMVSNCLIKNRCDVCILISGDADFLPAMQIIKEAKKEAMVSSLYKGFSQKFREGKFRYLILKNSDLENLK